jgi:hypothetical protein
VGLLWFLQHFNPDMVFLLLIGNKKVVLKICLLTATCAGCKLARPDNTIVAPGVFCNFATGDLYSGHNPLVV